MAPGFAKRGRRVHGAHADGHLVAVGIVDGLSPREIWIGNLVRGPLNRLVGDSLVNSGPVWSPDGQWIAFTSNRDGPQQNVYRMRADGSGIERLATSEYPQLTQDWSPDGKILLHSELHPDTQSDLFALTLANGTTTPLLNTPFTEIGARFSPNGHYVAFGSDRSGRFEVYVQQFPTRGELQTISTDGGTEPVWSHSGRELFFRQGDKMMAVDVNTTGEFSASRPHVLFEGRYEVSFLTPGFRYYDVSPDGRFLMVKSKTSSVPRQLRLITNWFEELKRLVPRN